MAKRTITKLVSDLSGDEITDGRTVSFAFDGVNYEIDLTDKEIAGFEKSIAMYLEHATRVGGRRGSGGKAKTDRDYDPKAVKAWAASNGIDVPSRGRIPMSVVEQFKAAGN